MPSKKKGKKGKKKQLSDEEKAKQVEMKALADREKLVRRRRLTDAFLKLKKEKEYELIKLNDDKLLDLWRPRLRKLKCNELLEDYKMLKAAFERNSRKKDELIENLEDMMKKNDEEYDNAFDMHIHNIDQMLEFYRKRLTQVREMYGEQKQKLLTILNDEKLQIDKFHQDSMKYLHSVLGGVNSKYRELASDSKAEMFIRQEEIRNKALEETHSAKMETDRRLKAVWDDIQSLLVEYDTKITPLRNEYQELRNKDDVVVATIDTQFRKMYKIQTGIEGLAEKDRNYCASFEKYLEELNEKKDALKAQYKVELQRFDAIAKLGMDNIRQLALMSGMVLESIEAMISQRERLLKCIERCRKRERLDEKVDPFMLRWSLQELPRTSDEDDLTYVHHASQEDLDGFQFHPRKIEHQISCDCSPCTCDVREEVLDNNPALSTMKEFSLLERFWIRFNRVSLERRVLAERKNSMAGDNYQLKLALRNYMGGMNPLQHNVETYSTDLMKTSHKNYQIVVQAMIREWKRRERSRKVGLRMH